MINSTMAAFGYEMAPGPESNEIAALQKRLADLEDEPRHAKRSAEQRFISLADASPAMIWMAGPDALHWYFNPAWLEFRGRPLEEEGGNCWPQGLHQDDLDLCLETYLKSFSARQRFRMQYRMRSAANEFCWVESVGSPVYNEAKDFVGFLGSAWVVSGRKTSYFPPDDHSVRMLFSMTERERQVLVLIAHGRSTKEAAANLGISYKTADSHRSRIL